MNVEQEISGLKERTGWLWIMVIVVAIVSCTNSSRLKKLERQSPANDSPTKPRPGALLLPTAPHVPAVLPTTEDQVAAGPAAPTSGPIVRAAGQAMFS